MSYHRHIFHLITRTKGGRPTIPEATKRILFAYIYEICRSKNWYLHRLNGYLNHIHLLVELPGTALPADVMKKIKGSTSHAFKHHPSFPDFEGWGEGYGSFTVSYGNIDVIKNYIATQEEHHRTEKFNEEYNRLLKENGIEI